VAGRGRFAHDELLNRVGITVLTPCSVFGSPGIAHCLVKMGDNGLQNGQSMLLELFCKNKATAAGGASAQALSTKHGWPARLQRRRSVNHVLVARDFHQF
jgi:hypothetical protein